MFFIFSILSILSRSLGFVKGIKSIWKDPVTCVAESDQTQSTALTLEKLPADVLYHIARFLTLDSIASLILSCKSLRCAIGQQSWVALGTEASRGARLSFLFSLQRDVPECVLCFYCVKLHCVKEELAWYNMWYGHDDLPCTKANGAVHLLPIFFLPFRHAQMVMKLHKLGATNTTWLNCLCFSNWYFNQTYHDCYARIVDGNLLVKVEYRMLLHHGQSFRQARHNLPHLCPHFRRYYEDVYSCQFQYRVCHGCAECVGLTRCRVCGTEITVANSSSDWMPNGRAIHVTAWKNLGPCDTPVDPRWRTQVKSPYTILLTERPVLLWRRGSIRKAFEGFGSSETKVGELVRV
jgi:hypothetical protein